MKARPVLYDLSGLLSRVYSRTPNGVDRVNLAFADHFLRSGEQCFGLVRTVIGPRVFSSSAVREVLEMIRGHWGEAAAPDCDEHLASVVAALRDASRATRFSKGRSGRLAHVLAWIAKHGVPFGQSSSRLPAQDSIYLNVGPIGRESSIRWLDRRPDVDPVFFIHDLLPLQFPEYFVRREYSHHSRRLKTVARRACAVLVPSETVRTALACQLSALGRRDMPILVTPLAPDPIFSVPDAAPPTGDLPYFLMCGTIEPRKNHLLILHVWRDLVDRRGDGAPKLVLVGERGWENEQIRDLLDRSPRLRQHVVEVSGLPTPSLKRLMMGARALLMPSFGEGYGLPVVEALALALPVIASDIPVFREIGDGRLTLIDPTDGPRWRETICAFADESSGLRAQALANMVGYRVPTWPAIFWAVETFLADLKRARASGNSSIEPRMHDLRKRPQINDEADREGSRAPESTARESGFH